MSKGRVFITGLEGFTGHYLKAEFLENDYEVYGSSFSADNLSENVFACNINDTQQLTSLLNKIKPDYLINLAGIAFVQHGSARAIFESNLLGVSSLLEAITASKHTPKKLFLVSSAHIYGNQLISPIRESHIPKPSSEYGISKLAMESLAELWFHKLPIIIVRPFNYTGIGQSNVFLPPKIINHFARRLDNIELGNLSIARDWSDVRDVAQIYRRLIESEAASVVVNVCSGLSHSLEYILTYLSSLSGHSINVQTNEEFIRTNEITALCGDKTLLESIIGSFAHRPLSETLKWMYQSVYQAERANLSSV